MFLCRHVLRTQGVFATRRLLQDEAPKQSSLTGFPPGAFSQPLYDLHLVKGIPVAMTI